MNIDHLRDFLCVAETLNLTLAADRRNTTQSNFSKRLRKLEDFLGRALIDRGSRPLCLTAAGEEFVPKARQILADIDSFRGQTVPWSQREGGLSIVMPHNATVAVFPQFKEWLSHRMADVHFAPLIANYDTAARLVAGSKVDLALVTRHPRVPLDENHSVFRYADIGRDRLVVAETPGASTHEELPLHLSHPLTYIGQIWQTCCCDLPVSRTVLHGMAADVRAHCLAGRGRGVLPESLVEADSAAGRLVIRETGAKLDYAISLYCAPQASRRAKQVWTLAAEYLANESPKEA